MARRNTVEDGFITHRVSYQRGGVSGIHITGSDGIHIDVMLGPFVGHGLSDPGNTVFGSGVWRDKNPTLKREQRGDIDDLAATLLHHNSSRCLRQKEHRLKVDLYDI